MVMLVVRSVRPVNSQITGLNIGVLIVKATYTYLDLRRERTSF